ncbi:MAG TPA: alpha/beta fold hydrolase [Syntrophomonadaceae bacterium]|nr:alpha/beta fold hydrolase [Syntrophomonadaceae bacterium]
MEKKLHMLTGTAEEIGVKLQKNYDRMLESSQEWAEILTFDPAPQTGLTPKEIVWRKNKARLYRYTNNDIKHKTPVLMIYALINKPYILDLIPGMSLVEHLVAEGFDVYLLDWGEWEWEDRDISFGDIVDYYIARAVMKVCQISKVKEISILGYCMGGTIATMYAALYPAPTIKNMLYLAAPIDFQDAGLSSVWLKDPEFDPDRVADTFQLIPKDFVDFGVKMLRPVTNFWGTYTRLWKSIDEGTPVAAWKALNKWVDDNSNFPGAAYRQWIKDLYQGNKLVKNEFYLKGRLVDIANINAPLLVMSGENDHLVRPHQAEAIIDHARSTDKTYHEFPVGHGGLVFGSYAKRESYPVISDWLSEHS